MSGSATAYNYARYPSNLHLLYYTPTPLVREIRRFFWPMGKAPGDLGMKAVSTLDSPSSFNLSTFPLSANQPERRQSSQSSVRHRTRYRVHLAWRGGCYQCSSGCCRRKWLGVDVMQGAELRDLPTHRVPAPIQSMNYSYTIPVDRFLHLPL